MQEAEANVEARIEDVGSLKSSIADAKNRLAEAQKTENRLQNDMYKQEFRRGKKMA